MGGLSRIRSMLALAAVAIVAPTPAQLHKYVTLDDFTVGEYAATLSGENFDYHVVFGLDTRHCRFGERRTHLHINSNPNQTTLTLTIGSGVQSLSSPLQVAWEYYLEYGNDGLVDVDFSGVDRFLLDMYASGGSYIPDSLTMTVTDKNNRGGTVGWNLRPGGVYFNRANFPLGIDWKHIVYLRVLQDFHHLPNPTIYTVTKFYARVGPVLVSPGPQLSPIWGGG